MTDHTQRTEVRGFDSEYDRCSRCGDTLIADGTEEADFATMCPECDDEYRAELDGDNSNAL